MFYIKFESPLGRVKLLTLWCFKTQRRFLLTHELPGLFNKDGDRENRKRGEERERERERGGGTR